MGRTLCHCRESTHRRCCENCQRAWGGGKIQEQLKQPEPDSDPQWLLNMAVRGNRADFVRQLLAAGVDPHDKDPEGKAAWQNAVGAGVARVLLEAGVSPDGTNRAGAETWLHLAGELGSGTGCLDADGGLESG